MRTTILFAFFALGACNRAIPSIDSIDIDPPSVDGGVGSDLTEMLDLDAECGVIGRQCCTIPICAIGTCVRDEDAGIAYCR